MRLFFAGAFVFLSVLLSVLYFPLTAPAWLKGIAMILAFFVSMMLARKYIHFSFVHDQTITEEQQFELTKENHHEP
jgi:hypothetical protein